MAKSEPDPQNPPAPLAAGERLGPYRILGLLGSGGMADVYRAHDSRLRRDVAIKILRGSAIDTDYVAQVSREARVAGSLNHPNIVAVYDVDTQGGQPYVVTELLQGETLRARLDRGLLPYRKAVDYGIQIAQALDAAHAKGIWHRDVKPANAFITPDGRVKLLDFGLAKLSERSPVDTTDSTRQSRQLGDICGTAGYMSPEQVLGGAVDHRTDIFALGAVLYEMFTGARAFQRPSTVQTMSAVLQDDPVDPLTLNAKLPPAAAALVRRCLEKDKEERFQSARDLAFLLQQLRDLITLQPSDGARANTARRLVTAILGSLLLAAGAALAIERWWPTPVPSFEQLTFRRARIGGARFGSEGRSVVYSETGDANSLAVFRLDLDDNAASRPPSYPDGTDVLAARMGSLALSMRRRFVIGERFVGTLALAGPGSGAPRELVENVEDADWHPTSEQLVMVRSTGDAGGHSWIEYEGRTLHKSSGSIRFLRFSRDGQRIAFLEDPAGLGTRGAVKVVDLNGQVTSLTEDWATVRGLAWSPDGDEVWFTAGTGTHRSLRAVNMKKKQRLLQDVPGSLTLWDIAPDGRALVSRDEEGRSSVFVPPGEATERELSWSDYSSVADLSADGRWLLFGDRDGIYLRSTDGAPPIPLGLKDGFAADDISPDGKTVLATISSGRQLVLVPTGAGEPRKIPPYGIVHYQGAQWFPDGRRIVFSGREDGRDLRSYIQDINEGPPKPLTPENTWVTSISPDGEWTAAIRSNQAVSLWPVAGGPSRPVKGTEPGERPVAWSADAKSLWLFRRGEVPANVFRLDIATGRRELWKTLMPLDAAGVYSIVQFWITPSGHAYVYSYTRLVSQLYLLRGVA